MPTSLDSLPRDSSGAIQGAFRLRHHNPGYTEGLQGVGFRDGVSTMPVSGPLLARLVAACGTDFDVEPWGEPSEANVSAITPLSVATSTEAPAESAAGASVCSIDEALTVLGYRVRVAADGESADVIAADGSAVLERVDEDDVRDWLIETGQYEPQTGKVQKQSAERVLLRGDDDTDAEPEPLPDDRDALCAIADALGIRHTPTWGIPALKKHIRKHQGLAP